MLFYGTLGLLAAGKGRAPAAAGAPGRRRAALFLLGACWCAAAGLRFSSARALACALDPAAPPALREACGGKAAAIAPGDPALLGSAAAVSLAVHGNYALAAALAKKAVSRKPKDPFVCFETANLYKLGGDPASARKYLSRALALEPYFLRARLALAAELDAAGERKAAARELRKIETFLAAPPDLSGATPYDKELLALPAGAYAKLKRSPGKGRP